MFPDLSASCWRYSLILIVHQLAVVLTLHLLPRFPELLTAETDGEDRNLLMLHTTNIYCSNCSSVRNITPDQLLTVLLTFNKFSFSNVSSCSFYSLETLWKSTSLNLQLYETSLKLTFYHIKYNVLVFRSKVQSPLTGLKQNILVEVSPGSWWRRSGRTRGCWRWCGGELSSSCDPSVWFYLWRFSHSTNTADWREDTQSQLDWTEGRRVGSVHLW